MWLVVAGQIVGAWTGMRKSRHPLRGRLTSAEDTRSGRLDPWWGANLALSLGVEVTVFVVFFAVKGEFADDAGGAAIAALVSAVVLAPYVLVGSGVALALLLRTARRSGAAPSRGRAVALGLVASAPLGVALLLWLGPVALAWTLGGGLVYGALVRLPQVT